ncbi:DUF6176 family protein [Fulvimonas soli]|nr:DUF6176 family protein [Fulvimonas soli]TNY26406.1 hypothetical protein BV497_08865 [Fulvimonas soli]
MSKPRSAFLAGLLAGIALLALVQAWAGDAGGAPPALRHPLQVRLHRVEIRDDGLGRYADWQRFLHARHDDAVATLAREHMYVEAMFRDPARDPHVLYWLEVRDDAGAHSNDSGLDVDREHERYMREVLRGDTWSVLATENVLVAPFVQDAIARWQAQRDTARAGAAE